MALLLALPLLALLLLPLLLLLLGLVPQIVVAVKQEAQSVLVAVVLVVRQDKSRGRSSTQPLAR